MISVSSLELLVYVAIGCVVVIPIFLGALLFTDWKRGNLW